MIFIADLYLMKNNSLVLLLILSLIIFSCRTQSKTLQTVQTLPSSYNPVVAHRGAWKASGLPENSLASLKKAIELDCAGSETDLHMTADSMIVIHHDPKFNGLEIQKTDLSELHQFKLSNGESLPLLSDFLKIIKAQKRTMLVLEIKPSRRGKEWAMATVKKVVDEVNLYNAQSHIIYISFDLEMCKEVLRLVPGAKVQYLNGDKTPAQLKEEKITGLDYNLSVFKKHPEYISDAKKLGLILDAWTVNDLNGMQWLIKNGFDYITTNEPELLFEIVNKTRD